MLDDAILTVLDRLDREDADDRVAGIPTAARSLPVGPESGRVLLALAAAIPGCRALEVGASRGYSTLWLAAGARASGGTVTSLELNPNKVAAWRRNVADAGLGDVASLVVGDAYASLRGLEGPFDLVLLDTWKDDYEPLFALIRPLVRRGGIVVADNASDSADRLGGYLDARRDDPTLSSVLLPVDNGLEVTSILA